MLRSIIQLIEFLFGIDDEPIDYETIASLYYESNQFLYWFHCVNPDELMM
ncbi:MAG: hypothetical protein JWN30_976 [Bacilli bacterium]|nr:hypothetical protein [Bacilli bacterium]